MKRITALLLASVTLLPLAASADTYVQGYTKSDGTYVQGHMRASPNANRYDNPSSQSLGGTRRDEFSSPNAATNKRNPVYGGYDNDGDGVVNQYDRAPNNARCSFPPC